MAYRLNDRMDVAGIEMASDSSSIGEAVSGRGQAVSNEDDDDDDAFYIPERRPSLDLGPVPMDISHRPFVGQASPPALSYSSMISEENLNSMDEDDEDGPSTRVQLNREDSFSSSYSFDSDDCEKRTPKAKNNEDAVQELSDTPELYHDPNATRHPSLTIAFTLKAICSTLGKLSRNDIKTFHTMLWRRYPQTFNTQSQSADLLDLVDRLLECYSLEVSLQITKTLLEDIGQKRMVDYLQTLCIRNEVRHDLSETLKKKFSLVGEDSAMQGEKRAFDDVFTNLYLSSTSDNGPNIEHEVMSIKKLDTNREPGERLFTKDMLSVEKLENSILRLLMVVGVAGSGKSMAVRRLVLDWIEERSHHHVLFMFPFTFRELKQFEGSKISLLEIINTLYPETKKLRDEDYRGEDGKIMFVFDGLDEYNGKLDFQNTELVSDLTESTSLNVLVVNLLRGRLLFRGLFMVTSRPQVERYVPWDTPSYEIDLRGFCDPEKDEYFKRRFTDPDQAAQVIAYINSSKTLRIMCHLPLFCSLVADEYQYMFSRQGTQAERPRSLTYMYTKLLLALMRQHRRLRAPDLSPEEARDFLMKLGKLALNMLEKGEFKISTFDCENLGSSLEEAVVNTGLCTQYITTPMVLYEEKVLSFIHPTMQEYLAALYAFMTFRNHGKNIFDHQLKHKVSAKLKGPKELELYKRALDKGLPLEDGKLDIVLRFLFGMANRTNQELLAPFFSSSVKSPAVTEDAAALIRKKIKENQYPGRISNLHLCLEELGV